MLQQLLLWVITWVCKCYTCTGNWINSEMTPRPSVLLLVCLFPVNLTAKESDAGNLYRLMLHSYNKIARPVANGTEVLEIKFGCSLIRIIGVDEKNQVLTTNLWLEIEWKDNGLTWDPAEHGGVEKLHIPADEIWTPDIVLYNNAAGDPEITIYTDAQVFYNGRVLWKPPAIYKSYCEIDVTWFPYDEQFCEMKFGMWTYTGDYVDMRQLPREKVQVVVDEFTGVPIEYMAEGMDLSYYYKSGAWDLLNLTSRRYEVIYASCCGSENYVDIRYFLRLRRKSLFYTVNLIVPCIMIAVLCNYVLFVPKQRITFAVSILVTLIVFFLILIELIPPTSVVIPLFGKYLLFTSAQVSCSIVIGIMTVNVQLRSANTHVMPRWIRVVFIEFLPRVLRISNAPGGDMTARLNDRKEKIQERWLGPHMVLLQPVNYTRRRHSPCFGPEGALPPPTPSSSPSMDSSVTTESLASPFADGYSLKCPCCTAITNGTEMCPGCAQLYLFQYLNRQIQYVLAYFRTVHEEEAIAADWAFVALVINRICAMGFAIINIVGLAMIILRVPVFYDNVPPVPIPSAVKPLAN